MLLFTLGCVETSEQYDTNRTSSSSSLPPADKCDSDKPNNSVCDSSTRLYGFCVINSRYLSLFGSDPNASTIHNSSHNNSYNNSIHGGNTNDTSLLIDQTSTTTRMKILLLFFFMFSEFNLS